VPVSIIPLTPDDMTETGRGILHAAEEVARAAAPDVRLESRLTRGPRARAIVEAAGDARLLVVGRDRSLAERIVSGRTAAAVAGRSPCPVESVPPDWEAGRGHGPVVVGVRSTKDCGPLLAHAWGLAAERHARLVVLHAWKMASGYDDIIEARVATDELDRRPTAELAAVLDEIGSGLPEVPTEIRIVHDRPAHALVTASKDADLMVLMRRHHRGPDTWRLGATGRAVLGTARCSVRVVPPLGSPVSSGAPLEASADLSGLSGR
jgi:nucleotide-binding universal stress UspA family protein